MKSWGWKRVLRELVVLACLVIVAVSLPIARRAMFRDGCLDAGGRIDADGSCDGPGHWKGARLIWP